MAHSPIEILLQADLLMEQLIQLLPEGASVIAVLACVLIFQKASSKQREDYGVLSRKDSEAFRESLKIIVDAHSKDQDRLAQEIGRLGDAVTRLAEQIR